MSLGEWATRNLIVGNCREIREGERKTTFEDFAVMFERVCANEFSIRCRSCASSTSEEGKLEESSAMCEDKVGLADVVSLSVRPSKNPALGFPR